MGTSDVLFISIVPIRSPAWDLIIRTSEHTVTICSAVITHHPAFQGRLRHDVKVRTGSGEGKLIFVIACRAKCSVTSFLIQTPHKPLRGFLAADARITSDLEGVLDKTLDAHTTVCTHCLKHFISPNFCKMSLIFGLTSYIVLENKISHADSLEW